MADRNHDMLDDIAAWECWDATYPCRQQPLVFDRALGSNIWDVEGQEYIDLCAGFGALALGHNHPRIQAIFQNPHHQIIHGMGDVYPSADKHQLLKALQEVLPFAPARVSLSLSGSQAVETALKTAMLYTQSSGIIAFEGSYHGVDLGVLPITHRQDFSAPFVSWLRQDQVEFVPWSAEDHQLEAARQRLLGRGHKLAAVIAEPIQGRAGGRMPELGFFSRLRSFCDGHSSLLILDEVFTGWGRIGSISQATEYRADLICWGKALGGSMPLSLCAGPAKIMEAWPRSQGEAIHTGTFFGHPFSCRIAVATIEEITQQGLAQRSLSLGSRALEFLQGSLLDDAEIKEIRGQGLMIVIEFKQTGRGAALMDQLRSQGVIALAAGSQGQCLSLSPALNISEELLMKALHKITQVIQTARLSG